MHSFQYRDGHLHCEDTDLSSLADKHGTPLYVYSKATIVDHYRRLEGALSELDHLICYAVKANSNLAILDIVAAQGGGFDIVSGGELYRILQAGGDASKCTFAGVGKTPSEIEYALQEGIYCFNVESVAELKAINRAAQKTGKKAPVALRVNPDVDADTHDYISTGKSENKFGIEFDQVADAYAMAAAELPHLKLKGLQMHIGSQLTSVAPFMEAVEKVAPLAAQLKKEHRIEFFSIGGGIGIIYQGALDSGSSGWWEDVDDLVTPLTVAAYAGAVAPAVKDLGLRILLEPGRYLVGNAGVLLTRVLYSKAATSKTFKIVDAGMNDLIRPALYEGHHDIVPVRQPQDEEVEMVDIVGPVCESGDFFCQDRDLPPLGEGDLIAVMSSGAYGFAMASNYNSRPLPAEVLVEGSSAHVIRERQSMADLVTGEKIPAPTT